MNNEFTVPALPEPPKEEAKWVSFDDRRDDRRTEIPAIYKTAHERLAVDLALRMANPEEVFTEHGFTPAQALELTESPAFTALCKRVSSEIRETGLSYRLKARAIAEELLPEAFDIATDPLQSGAVRAKIIEWVTRVAGHEPAPAKGGVGEGAGGFNLSITFAGQPPQQIMAGRTIDHQPGE